MLSVVYADCYKEAPNAECCHAECHHVECCYADRRYAECRGTFIATFTLGQRN